MALIEVFADIWCPFTHVGLHALRDQLVERHRGDARIWVRSWPLEWVNGRPMDRGSALEHALALREQVAPYLFEEFDGSRFPRTTIPALALAAEGYRAGWRVGESLSFELREALFDRGQDVSEQETLERIGRAFGLDPPGPDDFATVASDWKEGRSRGVRGSPHFFCGRANIFCPSLEISEDPDGQRRTMRRNMDRLKSFLDECLPAGRSIA